MQVTTLYLFFSSFFFILSFGIYPAKERPYVRCTHCGVTALQGIVREDIDVGLIPAMTRIFLLRKPPRVLGRTQSEDRVQGRAWPAVSLFLGGIQ